MFMQNKPKCVGCKTVLKDEVGALCDKCHPKETEIYMGQLSELSSLQIKANRCWAQCQRCQGSLHELILCTR
jgi:DNA polymerase delta subunit 1